MPDTNRAIVGALAREARKARARTLETLARVPEAWLYRHVDWTDNTIGWHLGHIAYELDNYDVLFFGAEQAVDPNWQRLFGYGCEPLDADAYPPPAELRRVFHDTLARSLDQMGALEDAALLRAAPGRPACDLLNGIVENITHEAEHAAAIETLLNHFERLAART